MAEVTLDYIGEQLRRLLDGQRLTNESLSDLKARVTALELSNAGIRRDLAALAEADAMLSVRMDRIDARLERIERRLDLVEA